MSGNAQTGATAPAVVPAGWYQDPSGQPMQRYWDGVAWSAQYTRPLPEISQQQQFVSHQATTEEYRQLGMPAGIPWMIVGALLTIARLYYAAVSSPPLDQSSAYNQGAQTGMLLGFFIGAIIFAHGFYQYRDWIEDPTSKPARRIGLQVLPVALPITIVGFVLATVMA